MSIHGEIIKYLEEKGSWTAGGTLERDLGYALNHKNSNISRRARELTEGDNPVLERQLVKINGKGPRVVQYRVKPLPIVSRVEVSRLQVSLF